ncbi:O-methyltransferase-domain-containing protein [Aspergillus crustosus]
MDPLTLKERAAAILQTTTTLADELAQTGHPEPTFEHGIPPHLHGNAPESPARTLKHQLFLMVDELQALLSEPVAVLGPEMRLPTSSINPIVRLGIAENFPPEGSSVQDLAKTVNAKENIVRRLLAHSATHHVFYEAEPDFFVHTAASRALSQYQGLRDWIRVGAEEVLPGTLRIADALVEFPDSEEPQHCGWSLANNTPDPVFKALAALPDRATRIATTMHWQTNNSGFSPTYLADAFPWGTNSTSTSTNSNSPLTIVDVGGSLGHISLALATHTHPRASSTKFIIQDRPEIITAGESSLPENLKDRVSFQAHDFFTDQPAGVHGADIYLLRSVLHDWSDKYAVKILRALIPGLRRGAKVLVNERVVPGWREVDYLVERHSREFDMYMLGFQNAKERTRKDWEGLITQADERFQLTGVTQQKGSLLALLEITWRG